MGAGSKRTTRAWCDKMGTTKNGPAQSLYWKFSPKQLESWYAVEDTPGTSHGDAAHFEVIANVITQGSSRTYRYDALCVWVDGQWYVDPDSLAGGVRVHSELEEE